MKPAAQILVNTLTGWGAAVVRSLLALILVPFLIKAMGQDGYGLIGLLGVIVGLSSVADLGLRLALGRELSEKVARKDEKGFYELASTSLLLYLVISGLISIVFIVLAPWLAVTFKVPLQFQADAIFLIRTYGPASIVIGFISPVFSAGISSFMRFDAINVLQISTSIFSNVLLLVLLWFLPWNPIYIYVWVSVGVTGVQILILWRLYRKWCFAGHIGFRYINISQLRSLFGVGAYMYVSQIANTISEQSDPLVISYFMGVGKTALYHPALRLSCLVRPVVLTLSEQLHPQATRYNTESDQERLRKMLLLSTRFTLLLGSLASAGIMVFAEPFCRIWLGNSLGADYHVVVRVMQLYAILDLLSYCGGAQWPVLLGMKKLNFIFWNNVPTAILNILLSIYFVGFTSLGVPGVLIGSIVARLIRCCFLVIYTSRLCGLTPLTYLREGFLGPSFCLFWTMLMGGGLLMSVPCTNWFAMIALSGVTTFAWAILALGIGVKKEERLRIWELIQAKMKPI